MEYTITIQESDETRSEQQLKEIAQKAVREANREVRNRGSSDDESDDSGGRLSYDEMCDRMRSDE